MAELIEKLDAEEQEEVSSRMNEYAERGKNEIARSAASVPGAHSATEAAELDEEADVGKSPQPPLQGGELGQTHRSVPTVPISELRKVRAEAAGYRRRLRDLESKVEKEKRAAELAKMEETDRLKVIAEEAEAKAKVFKLKVETTARQAAVINAASALGFHNPKDAASIIDLGRIGIDDDGNVDEENVNELVKSLAESRPYLIKEDGGVGGAPALPGDFGPTNPPSAAWPRPKLKTKDQIDRLKDQSREAMRSGRVAAAVKLYNRAWEMERGVKKK